MQRILFLLFILVAFGVGSWWLWQQNRTTAKVAVAGADREFAVPDAEQIDKIFMVDRFNNRTTLTRQPGDKWLLDGTYPVRDDAMKNLMRAITKVEMKFKPSAAAEENILQSLASEGIKVEIYNRDDRLLKSYYVGGATNDEAGTYMMLAGYDQPYITHIPGFVGNLRFRYNLIGDDWRDRSIFRANVDDIVKVSVDYPRQRNKSFIIEREGDGFDLSPFYSTTPAGPDAPIQGRMEEYLIGFKSIIASRFANEFTHRDSVQALTPFVEITLEKKDGSIQQAALTPKYNKPDYDRKTNRFINPTETISTYYVTNQDGDLLLAQHQVIEHLFWAYPYFFPEPVSELRD